MKIFRNILKYLKEKNISISTIFYESATSDENIDASVVFSFNTKDNYIEISIYNDEVIIFHKNPNNITHTLQIEEVIEYLDKII